MAVKTHRGGKYSKGVTGTLAPKPNTAGQRHELRQREWGTKRKFVGSGTKEYTFYSETRGTLTVRADDYWAALKIARSRGYSRRRYRRKK